MKAITFRLSAFLPLALLLSLLAADAHAADSANLLNNVLDRYMSAASAWGGVITSAASRLFWSLVAISMVITFGFMLLRKADIQEFFAEFVRFTMFTGFYWWLLSNAVSGMNIAGTIFSSMGQLGKEAAGLSSAPSPSGVVDVGFAIFDQVVDQTSLWSPVDSVVGVIFATVILVILALVGVNMLLVLVASWVTMYAGIFILGLGGSRWTSDMAINYYKTVLGVAFQFLTMVLLVGIGKTFVDDYYAQMNAKLQFGDLAVMLIVAVILLILVNKLPAMISGIITGASVGGMGVGAFGAGAALGAAGMAAAAAGMAGSAVMGAAKSAGGGTQALMAAFSKANQNVDAGTDVMSSLASAITGGGSGGGGGSDAGTGNTPLAEAAGFSGGTSAGDAGGSTLGSASGSDSGMASSGDDSSSTAADGGSSSSSDAGGQAGGDASGSGSGQNADTAAAGGGQGGKKSSDSSLAHAAKGAGRAGRIAADAGANLAKGVGVVAAAKAAELKAAAMERLSETTGGKIAAAIKGQGGSSADTSIEEPWQEGVPSFAGNSLAAADEDAREVDPEEESAAFVNRGQAVEPA